MGDSPPHQADSKRLKMDEIMKFATQSSFRLVYCAALQGNVEIFFADKAIGDDPFLQSFREEIQHFRPTSWCAKHGFIFLAVRRVSADDNTALKNESNGFARVALIRIVHKSTEKGRRLTAESFAKRLSTEDLIFTRRQATKRGSTGATHHVPYTLGPDYDLTTVEPDGNHATVDQYITDKCVVELIKRIHRCAGRSWAKDSPLTASKYFSGPPFPAIAVAELGYSNAYAKTFFQPQLSSEKIVTEGNEVDSGHEQTRDKTETNDSYKKIEDDLTAEDTTEASIATAKPSEKLRTICPSPTSTSQAALTVQETGANDNDDTEKEPTESPSTQLAALSPTTFTATVIGATSPTPSTTMSPVNTTATVPDVNKKGKEPNILTPVRQPVSILRNPYPKKDTTAQLE